MPQPMPAGDPGCTSCGNGGVSAYSQATMSPGWEGGSCNSCGPAPVTMAAPVGLRNWFGSAGVMIMDVVDNCDRPLVHDVAAPATTVLRSSDAGFDTLTGGSFSIGRYIGCGRYAIVGNYWFINPDSSATTINVPGGGDYRSVFPQWDRAYVDLNNDNAENVGEDMYALYDAATAYRITRDIDIQNVEVSMIGFGIGGASRVGVPGCNSVGCGGSAFSQAFSSGGCGSSCGSCNTCAPALGCAGGPCGPLVPSCSCRLRASYGHGIRWFRFKDNLEFAASLAQPGYGNTNDDMYYTVDVTNDLIGYQFTGRLDYCVGNRLSLYAGGKTGLYVNNIDYRSTLGTGALRAVADAYYPAFQGQNVMVDASETELAFLAELDLGANFNLTPCWTINGGYRIMGVSGLATSAVSSQSTQPT